jgi:hypothetical protein
MIGRAGRPQFDNTATVVIMTTDLQKVHYDRLIGGTQLIGKMTQLSFKIVHIYLLNVSPLLKNRVCTTT